jgi:peptidoglycan/LPS O-acetylase OafA/YrhL
LLTEKEQSSDISIGKFYLRRILRIWPLYYLVLILSLAAAAWLSPPSLRPPEPSKTWPLYFLMLPNVATALDLSLPALNHFWSLGVEEQFYALWPHIVKRSVSLKRSLAWVIGLYLALKLAARFSGHDSLRYFVYGMEFDSMALGGLGAVLYKEKSKWLKWFYSPLAQIVAWVFFIYSTVYKPLYISAYIDHEIYSVFFLTMILNVSTIPKSLVNLENPAIDFLGKISYGLYVYNAPVILALSRLKIFSYPAQIYVAAPAATVVVAALSYYLFEKRFIEMKRGASVILSQNSMQRAPGSLL